MNHTINKYHNKKTTIDGMTFDSKKEAERWRELELLKHNGEIHNLQRQVKFELLPKSKEERSVVYIADFVYTKDGKVTVEDVKGLKTREYIVKRKLFKYRFPECIFRES